MMPAGFSTMDFRSNDADRTVSSELNLPVGRGDAEAVTLPRRRH
jgi:hypothetical protein